MNNYYPFGLMWDNPETMPNATYQGKELQTDTWSDGSELAIYDFGARMYDPVLGKWHCADPMYQFDSPYNAMANNPVVNIDPDGMWSIPWGNIMSSIGGFLSSMTKTAITGYSSIPFMTKQTTTTQPNLGSGTAAGVFGLLLQSSQDGKMIKDAAGQLGSNWISPSWMRTLNFAINHPNAALRIGTPDVLYGTDISSISTRFAANVGFSGSFKTKQNAIRHVFWQATIRAEFGFDIAAEIGYAHEENPNAIDVSNVQDEYIFNGTQSFDQADEAADLLNNMIGRTLGEIYDASSKDLMSGILGYYARNGLWEPQTITNTSGEIVGYKVSLVKLSAEDHDRANGNLNGLDELGFNKSGRMNFDKQQDNIKMRRK